MRELIPIAALLLAFVGCNRTSHTTAATVRPHGMERYRYQCWEGGPHIVIPNAVAHSWRGNVIGANPLDPATDYGRACAIERWYGFIDVGAYRALVLPDPPLAAWDPTPADQEIQTFFVLRAWEADSLDELLDRAKQDAAFKETIDTWLIPDGGARMIYAGDDPDGSIAGKIDIPLGAGEYSLAVGEYNKMGDGHVIVLKFVRQASLPDNGAGIGDIDEDAPQGR